MASCHPEAESIDALAYKANENDGWGLMATDGEILVPSGSFEQQPTTVVNGMFSLPDAKGYCQLYSISQPTRPVSPRRFARIGHFFDKVTLAQETLQSPIYLIDKTGKNIASTGQYPQYDIVLAHNFRNGRALVGTRNGKYGYIDTDGQMVVPPLYDIAYDFCEGLALVGLTNAQGETAYQLIDLDGQVRLPIALSHCLLDYRMKERLLMFRNLDTGQCGYVDEEGSPVVFLPEEVHESYAIETGMAVFQTSEGTGIIDRNGQVLIPAQYEDAFVAGQDRIALRTPQGWGIAHADGTLCSPTYYEAIGHFYSSGWAVARSRGEYLLVNKDGQPAGTDMYARIVEDPTANGEVPQVFICQNRTGGVKQAAGHETDTSSAASAGKQQAEGAASTDDRLLTSPNGKLVEENELPSHSVVRSDEWKQIGRQSPFYEEANKVLSGKLEETDAENRRMILNYVEHLRTSYTTKDIDFLEQLFSENALIIVGTVIRTSVEKNDSYLSPTQVVYNVKSKRQYLDRLKQVFKANRSIQLKFSDFHIMRHPTQMGIYGVSLRQGYESDIYSDDGYLFLLWDFRDKTAPKIHVRTWQPAMTDGHTPLPEDEIFNIQNFNLQ